MEEKSTKNKKTEEKTNTKTTTVQKTNVEEKNGMAIAGFVCSLCGVFTCGLTSLIGLILSIIGLKKSKVSDGNGKGLAISGIVIGAIVTFIMAMVILFTGIITAIVSAPHKINHEINKSKIYDTEYYPVNRAFEFDDLEIIVSDNYYFDKVNNSLSQHNGKTVLVIPVTIKNTDDDYDHLNMFYHKIYGPSNDELDTVDSEFSDSSVDYADDLGPGESYVKNFYVIYDGDGVYTIKFDDYDDEIKVKLNVKK